MTTFKVFFFSDSHKNKLNYFSEVFAFTLFFLVTLHAQFERGKVIGIGVHIYIYIYVCGPKKI